MKRIEWNKEKNKQLKLDRGISFEQIKVCLESNDTLLDVITHHNNKKSPNQRIFVVNIDNYVYLVPFVEDDNKIFLKTIIPNREATKKYLITKEVK